jgi:hypothetical protein
MNAPLSRILTRRPLDERAWCWHGLNDDTASDFESSITIYAEPFLLLCCPGVHGKFPVLRNTVPDLAQSALASRKNSARPYETGGSTWPVVVGEPIDSESN